MLRACACTFRWWRVLAPAVSALLLLMADFELNPVDKSPLASANCSVEIKASHITRACG